MSLKISWPFGEKHPVVAVILLAFLEAFMIWSVWHSIARDDAAGRHAIVHNRPGIELFEFLLLLQVASAIGIAAMLVKVVRDAIKARSRKGS